MSELKDLLDKINAFRDARNWRQFHQPKDLAISLCLEAAEVLEHFQWKSEEEIKNHIARNKEELGDELADVLNYLLQLADETGIDLIKASHKKIAKNEKKYPVEKSRNKHTKYSQL